MTSSSQTTLPHAHKTHITLQLCIMNQLFLDNNCIYILNNSLIDIVRCYGFYFNNDDDGYYGIKQMNVYYTCSLRKLVERILLAWVGRRLESTCIYCILNRVNRIYLRKQYYPIVNSVHRFVVLVASIIIHKWQE